jgi:hypothetical protein
MPAELDKESVDTLRSLMAAQGLPADMPLLNTEVGLLTLEAADLGVCVCVRVGGGGDTVIPCRGTSGLLFGVGGNASRREW